MRIVGVLVCLVLVGCPRGDGGAPSATHLPGDAPPPDPDKVTKTTDAEPAPDRWKSLPDLTIAQACTGARKANQDGCAWATRFPPQFHERNNCEQNLDKWLAPGTRNVEGTRAMVNCWALPCDEAIDCMVASRKRQLANEKPRKCGEDGVAPVHVEADVWSGRRGPSVKRFSDANTSVTAPIEVCGIDGEVEWMMRATCDDGSRPYQTPSSVNDGRDSWVEKGGRCNSVLDRYTVQCPEKTYRIHVDRYICPKPSGD